MRILGILLILLGIFALVYKGVTYTSKDKIVDAGPIEATADHKKTVPLSPILGGLALAGGIALVVTDNKHRHHPT